MVNKVILIGNLGKDPEAKENRATFSVATTEKYNGETKTEWHNITVFKGLADFTSKYLSKGDKVYIEGKITYRKVEEKHYTNIVAFSIKKLNFSKDTSNGNIENNFKEDAIRDMEEDLPF